MPQKSEVYKEAVKHVGFWNYTTFYHFCYNWLKTEGYKVVEKSYTEKLSDFGKEIEIEWDAVKKVSDYFMNQITLRWHILGMKDAEVEIDGRKEKTNKGEVKITITANLVKDYESRWENKPFWKTIRGFYENHIIRTTIDEYEDRLQDKVESYIEAIKSFLVLEGKK